MSLAVATGRTPGSIERRLQSLNVDELLALQARLQPSTAQICQSCGACCASFRVSFYWTEALNRINDELIEAITPHLSCMRGTNSASPHCIALTGRVGERVSCSIYPHRSSTCRSVQIGDEKCDRARARHGLPPIREALESLIVAGASGDQNDGITRA